MTRKAGRDPPSGIWCPKAGSTGHVWKFGRCTHCGLAEGVHATRKWQTARGVTAPDTGKQKSLEKQKTMRRSFSEPPSLPADTPKGGTLQRTFSELPSSVPTKRLACSN